MAALLAVAGIAAALAVGILQTTGDDCAKLDSGPLQPGSTTVPEIGGNEVLAIVGCEEITLAEFREMVERAGYMREVSQRELDGELETGFPTELLRALQVISAFWGMDNVVLAGLILDSALYQKAVNAGISVEPGEVAEGVDLTRQLYERGEMDSYTVGYMESIGADRYWNEVLPQRAYRDLMIGKLQGDVFDDSVPPEAERWDWHDFVETVLLETPIRVVDSGRHAATLEGIMGQVSSVRELHRSGARMSSSLHRAPDDSWVVYVKPEPDPLAVIHLEREPAYCRQPATDSRWLCDGRSGEPLVEIPATDFFVIVLPGFTLPDFDQVR